MEEYTRTNPLWAFRDGLMAALEWNGSTGKYVACLPKLPGVSARGRDRTEVFKRLHEAYEACVSGPDGFQ